MEGTTREKRDARRFLRTVAEGKIPPVKIPVDNEAMICQCPVSGLPVRVGPEETGQRSAHRDHLLRHGPGRRGFRGPVDEAPFPDRVRGQRQRDAGKISRDREEPPFRYRVEVTEGPGVEKRRVEMVRDVEHAVDGELAGESLEQRDRLVQETQPGLLLSRKARPVDGERSVGRGEDEPVDHEHAEGRGLREGADGTTRMEGSQLQARLEKEAVPGLLPGVEADPLVGWIGAGEAKDRIRIPPLREAGQKSRRVEKLPELPGAEPAEEPVLGVLTGQIEGELALEGWGRIGALPRRQEGQAEQPAKLEPRDHGGGGYSRLTGGCPRQD